MKHTFPKDELILWGFDFRYIPSLSQLTPRLRSWLDTLSNKDEKSLEVLRLLFAQTFGLAPDLNTIFLLGGEPGTGKSTLFNLLAKLVGLQNVTGASVRHLDKFSIANMMRQRLITFTDISSNSWRQDAFLELIKSLSGRDPLSQKVKFVQKEEVGIFSGAVLVLSNFTTVLTGDGGIRRRLLPVYPNLVPTDPNPHLLNDLVEEAPRLVSWVLGISDDTLINPWKALGFQTAQLQEDPLLDFFQQHVRFERDYFAYNYQIYNSFKQYSKAQGYTESEIPPLNVFHSNFVSLAKRLAREEGIQFEVSRFRKKTGRGLIGLRLLEPEEIVDLPEDGYPSGKSAISQEKVSQASPSVTTQPEMSPVETSTVDGTIKGQSEMVRLKVTGDASLPTDMIAAANERKILFEQLGLDKIGRQSTLLGMLTNENSAIQTS